MNLADPKTLQAFLTRQGVSARKGLGQHFLCSEEAVSHIVDCLNGFSGALEIGPGPGVLTGPLSERLQAVVALEIDPAMAEALKESAPRARVLRQDALKADLGSILDTLPTPRAILSNLPYYITAPLVQAIAEARFHYSKAVLMMQSEVADRFMAPAGDSARGSISVYLQALFSVSLVARVPAAAFLPPPKVDSTVLEFSPLPATDLSSSFFDFVRQGFSQPRKTLSNNLASKVGKELAIGAIEYLTLSPTVRPHELTLDRWIELWKAIQLGHP